MRSSETFVGHHKLVVDQLHMLGVISLMFWSLMMIVTIKYIIIIMRADNKGEGGSLALLALIQRRDATGKRWAHEPHHAGRAGDRLVLRRLHDHAGDLGAVRDRGAGDGGRRGSTGVCRCRSAILVGLF